MTIPTTDQPAQPPATDLLPTRLLQVLEMTAQRATNSQMGRERVDAVLAEQVEHDQAVRTAGYADVVAGPRSRSSRASAR